jgi:uncharacterized membrane-anchored protein YhcB (DUF1043 family)
MDPMWIPVIVAVISGPLVVVIQRLRKENTAQHAEGRALLERVADKVDSVGQKLDEHIGWHKGRGK